MIAKIPRIASWLCAPPLLDIAIFRPAMSKVTADQAPRVLFGEADGEFGSLPILELRLLRSEVQDFRAASELILAIFAVLGDRHALQLRAPVGLLHKCARVAPAGPYLHKELEKNSGVEPLLDL